MLRRNTGERIFDKYMSDNDVLPTSDEKDKFKRYVSNNSSYDGNSIIDMARRIKKNRKEEKIC